MEQREEATVSICRRGGGEEKKREHKVLRVLTRTYKGAASFLPEMSRDGGIGEAAFEVQMCKGR